MCTIVPRGFEDIVAAVVAADVALLRTALENHDCTSEAVGFAMKAACEIGRPSVVRTLLCHPMLTVIHLANATHWAAHKKHVSILKMIVSLPPTPVWHYITDAAMECDDAAFLQWFLNNSELFDTTTPRNVEIASYSYSLANMFILACKETSYPIMEWFLSLEGAQYVRADTVAEGFKDACTYGNTAVVRRLLQLDDRRSISPVAVTTGFLNACSSGRAAVTELLLQLDDRRSISPDAVMTGFIKACVSDKAAVAELLLQLRDDRRVSDCCCAEGFWKSSNTVTKLLLALEDERRIRCCEKAFVTACKLGKLEKVKMIWALVDDRRIAHVSTRTLKDILGMQYANVKDVLQFLLSDTEERVTVEPSFYVALFEWCIEPKRNAAALLKECLLRGFKPAKQTVLNMRCKYAAHVLCDLDLANEYESELRIVSCKHNFVEVMRTLLSRDVPAHGYWILDAVQNAAIDVAKLLLPFSQLSNDVKVLDAHLEAALEKTNRKKKKLRKIAGFVCTLLADVCALVSPAMIAKLFVCCCYSCDASDIQMFLGLDGCRRLTDATCHAGFEVATDNYEVARLLLRERPHIFTMLNRGPYLCRNHDIFRCLVYNNRGWRLSSQMCTEILQWVCSSLFVDSRESFASVYLKLLFLNYDFPSPVIGNCFLTLLKNYPGQAFDFLLLKGSSRLKVRLASRLKHRPFFSTRAAANCVFCRQMGTLNFFSCVYRYR